MMQNWRYGKEYGQWIGLGAGLLVLLAGCMPMDGIEDLAKWDLKSLPLSNNVYLVVDEIRLRTMQQLPMVMPYSPPGNMDSLLREQGSLVVYTRPEAIPMYSPFLTESCSNVLKRAVSDGTGVVFYSDRDKSVRREITLDQILAAYPALIEHRSFPIEKPDP